MEHFGLGRYGDPIEPNAWESALKSFQRVLKPNGRLYFSVPVGDENRLCFNAHRVFTPETIIDTLDAMQVVEMSYIKGFDIVKCMQWENNNLCINQVAFKNIPKTYKSSTTGLFEFVKR